MLSMKQEERIRELIGKHFPGQQPSPLRVRKLSNKYWHQSATDSRVLELDELEDLLIKQALSERGLEPGDV